MRLALAEMVAQGGLATIDQIYQAVERAMEGHTLSRQGKATLREIVNRQAARQGYTTRNSSTGGWEITAEGRRFLESDDAGSGDDTRLRLVQTKDEVLDNVRNFGFMPLENQRQIPLKKYFVYDPISGWFAPAKLAGLAEMTINRYLSVDRQNPPAVFDGHSTRTAIERVGLQATSEVIAHQKLKEWLDKTGRIAQEPVIYSAGEQLNQTPPLDRLMSEIRSMQRGMGGTAPHKPLLLLAALNTDVPTFEAIRETYQQLAQAIGKPGLDMSQPYSRLNQRSDGTSSFYRIVDSEGLHVQPPLDTLAPLAGTGIKWHPEFLKCLQDYRIRERIQDTILMLFTADQQANLMRVLDSQTGPLILGSVRMETTGLTLSVIVEKFASALASCGLYFGTRHDDLSRAFLVSMATKRLVILTGLSGSGKTQIALKLGEWFGKLEVISVRPDWTGPEFLLGYEDALLPTVDGQRSWHVPRALQFLLEAAKDPTQPYLLILDEMNLAHVERYFADVLSGIESAQPCLPNLVKNDAGYWLADPIQPKICFPANVFIAGTVNVDETTYMFSPKVLDRANTIEFRVSADDLNPEIRKPVPCQKAEPEIPREYLRIAVDDAWQHQNPLPGQDALIARLKQLHGILSPSGFEFGHRVFYEVMRFAALHQAAGGNSTEQALDLQIMQKILPRLHGSRRKVEKTLQSVRAFCLDPDNAAAEASAPKLPRSFDKVSRMLDNLHANQFTSFTD